MRAKLLLGLMLMLILISISNAEIGTWNIAIKLPLSKLWKSTLNEQFQLSPRYSFCKAESGRVTVKTFPSKNVNEIY